MFLLYNISISLFVAIILILFLQQRIGWSSYLGRSGGLQLISVLVSFTLLLYLTVSNSVYLFLHPTDFAGWLPSIIPLSLLLGLIGYLSYGDYRLKKETEIRDKKVEDKKQECLEWIKQFSFIDSNEKYHISVYMSKNVAVGRLTLICGNEQDRAKVESKKDSVPSEIYLNIIKPFK